MQISHPLLQVGALTALLFSGWSSGSLAAKSPATSAKILALGSREEAYLAATACAAEIGGLLMSTSGTPSMEPLIHGRVYVVIQKRAYESIRMSDLLVYMGRCDQSKAGRTLMLHRTVEHDRQGWIMSGDNNRWSESWDRVKPTTYVGTVLAIFNYPQAMASSARTVRAN